MKINVDWIMMFYDLMHGDVECVFMCHLTLVDFVCIEMSFRVLIMVEIYPKIKYLVNE